MKLALEILFIWTITSIPFAVLVGKALKRQSEFQFNAVPHFCVDASAPANMPLSHAGVGAKISGGRS